MDPLNKRSDVPLVAFLSFQLDSFWTRSHVNFRAQMLPKRQLAYENPRMSALESVEYSNVPHVKPQIRNVNFAEEK